MFMLRRKLPAAVLSYVVNKVGSKKQRQNMSEFKDAVDKCEEIGKQFEHFTKNEWIFDN